MVKNTDLVKRHLLIFYFDWLGKVRYFCTLNRMFSNEIQLPKNKKNETIFDSYFFGVYAWYYTSAKSKK